MHHFFINKIKLAGRSWIILLAISAWALGGCTTAPVSDGNSGTAFYNPFSGNTPLSFSISGLRGDSLTLSLTLVSNPNGEKLEKTVTTAQANGSIVPIGSMLEDNYSLKVTPKLPTSNEYCSFPATIAIAKEAKIVHIDCGGIIATGTQHSCAIFGDKKLKCWGNNSHGQLGTGDKISLSAPAESEIKLSNGNPITFTKVSAGEKHTCGIVAATEQAICWGDSTYGQLGTGNTTELTAPLADPSDNPQTIDLDGGKVLQIVSGSNHNCALLDNNTVKCWGLNDRGQLGIGDTSNRGNQNNQMGSNLPVLKFEAKDDQGTTYTYTPVALTAGNNHTCAMMNNGIVLCWGANDKGQLARGADTNDQENPVVADVVNFAAKEIFVGIYAGGEHTCGILSSGISKCWGNNLNHQLGVSNNGQNLGDEDEERGAKMPKINLPSGRKAVDFALGNDFTCARLNTGDLLCWGGNSFGQLGLGNDGQSVELLTTTSSYTQLGTLRKASAISAGGKHVCSLLLNEQIKCWGSNLNGQLGLNSQTDKVGNKPEQMDNYLANVNLQTGNKAIDVFSGTYYSCALMDNYEVQCWGQNNNGQLGIGEAIDSVPRGCTKASGGNCNKPQKVVGQFNTNKKFRALSLGKDHVCAIVEDTGDKAVCWGNNHYGQLGTGNSNNISTVAAMNALTTITSPTGVISVAVGTQFSCAIATASPANDFYCWGDNLGNQLGLRITGNKNSPSLVSSTLNPDSSFTVTKASALNNGVCALSIIAGGVKCWGNNNHGQLGDGSYGGTVKQPPTGAIKLNGLVSDTQSGIHHSCVVMSSTAEQGQLKCWGQNNHGQLGNGNLNNIGDGPGEMNGNLKPVVVGGDNKVLEMGLGEYFSCAIRATDSQLFCWGDNRAGQLGINSKVELKAPNTANPINLGTNRRALKVAGGFEHTCALLDNGKIKCWGSNKFGQLGSGLQSDDSTNDRGDGYIENPAQPTAIIPIPAGQTEMGDKLEYVQLITN